MKKIVPICVRNENWRAHTAAIVSALLMSFSVIASAATPQNVVDSEQAEELVSLNLRDVDIGILIKTVANLSGKTIMTDPRVKAKVTFFSDVPLDSKQLYNVFLSILEVHDLAVVDFDDTIMVVPNDAINSPAPQLDKI